MLNIADKGVYTIVEEKNGTGATKWGKRKFGVGWISLDYVKKTLRRYFYANDNHDNKYNFKYIGGINGRSILCFIHDNHVYP